MLSRSYWRLRVLENEWTVLKRLVSSANRRASDDLVDNGKSLIKIKKRRGPNMLP